MNWKDWFERASRIAWQGVNIPETSHLHDEAPNSTEGMYQAFKARFLEETTRTSED